MASNNIARLGVVLGIDTAEFTAAIDRARAITRQMGAEMKRDMDAAAKEIVRLDHATSDYGKTLTQVQLVEREMHSGRYRSIDLTTTMRDRLLAAAAAYDAEAAAATKAAAAAAEADAKKKSIKDATDQGLRELQSMKYAMEDYGQVVSKATLMERAFATGHLQALPEDIKQKLRLQAVEMDKLANSTKVAATAQAGLTNTQKLNINYQLTDFFTQVASGQSVMIAAIQQGGQLKDSFGGVGGALSALRMFFTPAMLGFGALGAVIGAVAYAAYSGDKEFKALQDSIALTGNYSKVTAGDFYLMADAMSKTSRATVGDAKDVMSAMISSGQFTKQSFDSVTKTIITFSQLTGLSAKDATDKLIPSLDGTAQSALRLNNQYNFLTLAQYKNIEALNAQYKHQEAIVLTADLLTESWKNNQRSLGYLEQAYESTTKTVKNFWDALTGFGRDKTPEEKVEALKKSIINLQKDLELNPTALLQSGKGGDDVTRKKAILLKSAKELTDLQNEIANSNKDKAEKDLTNKYAAEKTTRQQKAGELDKAEIKLAYDMARQGASELDKLALDSNQARDELISANNTKNIQEEGKFTLANKILLETQLLDVEEKYQTDLKALQNKQYLTAAEAQAASAAAGLAEYQASIAAIEANAKLVSDEKEKGKITEQSLKRSQELFMLENSNRSIRAEDLQLEKDLLVIRNESIDARKKINESSIYASPEERKAALDNEARLTEIAVQGAMDRNARLKELRAGSFGQGMGRAADDYLTNMATAMEQGRQAFDSVISNMGTALDNFVKTGKLSFKDLAGSIIRDLIAIQLKASATGLFSMLIKGMFGVATGGASLIGSSASYVANGTLGFADGGSPPVGKASIVGENGPELFVPSGSGTIIPNHSLGGAGGTTNVTNNYINAIDTKSFEQRLLGSANAIWAANTYANKSLAVGRGRS